MTATVELGFCGLGAMGGGMARNLAKLGFSIKGYDVYPPSIDKLVEAGGKAAKSPADAAEGVDFLILMVVNSNQADQVLFDGGAVKQMKLNSSIILCSTTAPQYLLDLRVKLDSTRPDLKLLDCPVSGGSIRAGNGTLSIFSSGRDEELNAAKVVLEAMSDPLYRIPGGISMGSIAKMCHQHQAATNIIMASEIMGLAARAGLDTKAVYDAVANGNARSWMFGNRVPHMLDNDWLTVHSAVTIILKDATIVTSHAKSHGIPLLLANTAEQLYITGTFSGLAKEDDAALVKLYLPKSEPNLVGDLVNSAGQGKNGVTIETILDILKGFHLASTKECMVFASKAGMNIDLLVDIITKGAGASGMYDEAVPQMIKAGQWSLSVVKDVNEIREKFEAGLKKAAELRAPMPMAQAALQHFNFDV